MSRLSRSRVAVATGLTLGTATAGLLFSPAAFAAETPGYTVSPSTTLAPGAEFTLSGTGCFQADDTDEPAGVGFVPDVEEPGWGDGDLANEDGTWKLTEYAPEELGSYTYVLYCDQYTDGFDYNKLTITVTADGKPVPAATTPAPTSTAPAEFKPGAKPNTPGIASTTTAKTTGNAAAPGQKVVKVLKGFKPFEKVTLVLHSTPVELGTFTADANGVVTAEFTIPAGTPLGNHTLAYTGDKGSYFEDPLTLTKDGKALAYTGADVKLPLIGGTVLLAAGAGALVVGRRRRTGAAQA
jgi:hypothetical protein